ncbi:hypothetical protein [Microbacterium sp. MM2322]|uniref:hypothetical protein n=1 Tax=Microbacterium sp. MM2322 TaxID=3157631 RepID=UPI0032D57802
MNAILRRMLPELLEVAPKNCVYVIVTNPCDVLTVIGQEVTGLPPERIFASGTVLDTSRLRWKLAQRGSVDLERARLHRRRARRHRVPHWSRATIGTVPILDWQPLDGQPKFTVDELDRIAVDVRDAAYTVIPGKGATNYAIGLSSARIVEAILGDQHAVMPVSAGAERLPGRRRRCPLGALPSSTAAAPDRSSRRPSRPTSSHSSTAPPTP